MGVTPSCPDAINYTSETDLQKLKSDWQTYSPEMRMLLSATTIPLMVDAVKILEAKPALPYKYPYSYESKDGITCDKYPTLPDGITIPMLKKRINEMARIMETKIPFPEIEPSDYTMYYIILIVLIVVVAMSIMYKMSAKSNTLHMSTNSVYPSNNNGISEYY
jgi:hypothetical protein